MKKIEIELIHDLVCSWCYIGMSHINEARKYLKDEVEVSVTYCPYQLNPMLADQGVEIQAHLAERNGWDAVQLNDYRGKLLQSADKANVTIDFNKRLRYFRTEEAHGLLNLAEQLGFGEEMHTSLLHAYHVEGRNLSDLNVLEALGSSFGLSPEQISTWLESEELRNVFKRAKELTARYPVKSVPSMIVGGKEFVAGSQSVGFFVDLLRSRSAA